MAVSALFRGLVGGGFAEEAVVCGVDLLLWVG